MYILLLITIISAILVPALYIFNILFIRDIASSYISDIQITFGLSPYLEKAIIVVATAVLIFISGLVFSFSRTRRSLGYATISATLVGYYLLLWWGTEPFWFDDKGRALRCYVRMDEGIFFRRLKEPDKPQIDLETGLRCLPVTPSVRRDLKIVQKIMAREGIKRISTPQIFFNEQTGKPVVWFVRKDGSFRFFNAPIYDPESGQRARPVTRDIIRQYQEWKKEQKRKAEEKKERRRQAEEERKRQIAAKEARRKEKKKRRREQERLRHMRNLLLPSVAALPPTTNQRLGVEIFAVDVLAMEASAELLNALASRMEILNPVWRRAFRKEGHYQKLLAGDMTPAQETEVFSRLPAVLVGKLTVSCNPRHVVGFAGKSCAADFDGRLISKSFSRRITLGSRGFDVDDKRAAARSGKRLAERLKVILDGEEKE